MKFQRKIGEPVKLNGKDYTISGYHKRSYLLKDSAGKEYKCSPDKLDRIEAGIPRQPREPRAPSGIPAYFEEQIKYARLFKSELGLPNKENALRWAGQIYCELSPENLHCDGEISRSAAQKKYRVLMQALKYLEQILGRKIDEMESYAELDKERKQANSDSVKSV